MLQNKSKYPTVYNPASQSPEEIVSNFVIRLREFNELFEAIKNDKMEKPPQHFIVQGQRGYGKTTLLLRLDLAIKNDPDLDQWLLPVMFDEEQYNVHTLANLWEEVIDILEDRYESFAGLSDEIEPLYDSDSPEEKIFELLINALKNQNKKVVLLLDNFGDMIGKFERKENQRLREVLITSEHIRIIGASSAILEFYYNYSEPFYDFFKVITLDELDRDETISLLRKLSETYGADEINKIIETQPERIEALRRLTGGVPRTIVLLFEIFIDDVDGNSFKDLETILDRVTPLYKHRMDNLPVQQQTIVDALAQNWDAMSARDIAKKVRLSSKAASSQLNQLEKSQLVKKISTSTKNQLYQIGERFFNIYYLMRLGRRKNRNRVLWLVRFFELWCSENELVERAQKHIKSLREGRLYQPHAYWISQALSRTRIPDEIQHELITRTREYLSSARSPLAKELDKSHIEMQNEAFALIENGYLDSAERRLLKEGFSQDLVELVIASFLETKKKDFARAIEFYLRAIKGGNTDAMFNLALLYVNEFKNYEEAKKYYLMAVEKGHVSAMYNLAILYEDEYQAYGEAEKYYSMAVKNGVTHAKNNLALRYFVSGKKKDEALTLQREAYMFEPDTKVSFVYIMVLLWNNDVEEARKVYSENFDNENVQKDVSGAINSILLMFLAKKQYNFVYQLFEENKYNLRDKYKPVYFALLSLLGEEHKDEFLKMGPELKETVEEVISKIKKYEVDYA